MAIISEDDFSSDSDGDLPDIPQAREVDRGPPGSDQVTEQPRNHQGPVGPGPYDLSINPGGDAIHQDSAAALANHQAWLPDGYMFGPLVLKDYGSATLRCKI